MELLLIDLDFLLVGFDLNLFVSLIMSNKLEKLSGNLLP